MDTVSPNKRSEIMSKIRGKDTKIEVAVRKALFRLGFRYRKNVKNLPGKPDIVLPKYGVVIFVNGCFWHGHKDCLRLPKTHKQYWREKIDANQLRDQKNIRILRKLGWRVFTIWECKIKKDFDRQIQILTKKITSNP